MRVGRVNFKTGISLDGKHGYRIFIYRFGTEFDFKSTIIMFM